MDQSPSGDKAVGIAVDPQGFVDIVGDFSTQMQWPGLPELTNGNGGANTAAFTVKTQLTCTSVPSLQGTVLHLVDDSFNPIVITDDRNWGILVQVGQDPMRAYQGLTLVDFHGDGYVTAALRGLDTVALGGLDVMPPNLRFAFGDRNDTLNLMGDFSAGNPFVGAPWRIDIATGSGIYTIDTNILGSVPVAMTTSAGPGNISDIYELQDVEHMSLPSTFVFNGGLGFDDIKVIYGFNPQPEPPGVVGEPVSVKIGGVGGTNADVEYNFQPSSPGGPGDPPVFDIPLDTTIRTTGDTTAHVGYHFKKATGADNGIIAITAPFNLDIAGKKVHSAHVDFDDDVPAPGTAMPTVQMFSALNFHVAGGDGGTDVGLQFGIGNPDIIGNPDLIGNPELMPGSSLDARFTGGTGDDTVGIVIWMNPASTGLVNVSDTGGSGNDDLRLDVYGISNPDILTAVINGGTGRNTAHATSNVRVVNCEAVFLD
jgi:hypothetical protein